MEPSYDSNGITLYLGDALDVLPGFAGGGVVVTDPPYGMGYRSHHNSGRGDCDLIRKDGDFAPIEGDDRPFDPSPILALKPSICVLWGANNYASRLPDSRGWLVWDKLAGKTQCSQSDVELAWTNVDATARLYSHLWRGIMRDGEENVVNSPKLHPNQKPVALMAWSMETVKVPAGALVIDPYMGSASIGIACLRTGRRYLGIEKDPRHFKTALRRIENEIAQGDLSGRNLDDQPLIVAIIGRGHRENHPRDRGRRCSPIRYRLGGHRR